MLHDVRYACRLLVKSPAFTVVAVLTLALGIGANTAIFSVIDAVLLRPLPFPDADRLTMVWGFNPQIGTESASLPDFADWRAQNRSFEKMAGISTRSMNLTTANGAERVSGASITDGFFSMLGIQVILGRDFLPEEDKPGGASVAILSEGLWQRQFGGDRAVLGRALRVNGQNYTVVGVVKTVPGLPGNPQIWAPLARDPASAGRRNDFLTVIGRLKPNVTLEQAQSEMTTIMTALEKQFPNTNAGWTVKLVPVHEQLVGQVRPALFILLGVVGLVLLIGCANVANMLLARAFGRGKEVAVRGALGASRARLVRQFLVESVVLAGAGSVAGLVVARWMLDGLKIAIPSNLQAMADFRLSIPVLGFAVVLALLTGILFGLAPALKASTMDLSLVMKEGGGHGSGRRRLSGALVVTEFALSLILLTGAALLLHSFWLLRDVRPGFQTEKLLTMRLALPQAKYPQAAQAREFFRSLQERASAMPGAVGVAMINALPVDGGGPMLSFNFEGRPAPNPQDVIDANFRVVSANYFQLMGIPVLKGRALEDRDNAASRRVVVINETMAKTFWSSEDPMGKRIAFGNRPDGQPDWLEIVGIVADVRHEGLDGGEVRAVYVPYLQGQSYNLALLIRAASDPMPLAPLIRQTVREMDADQPVYGLRTMEQIMADSMASRQTQMVLVGLFAMVALLLGAVGIYGVMSYAVSQRTHEIGIRIALGAGAGDVQRMIVWQGMRLALIGIAIGLVGAVLLPRLLAKQLYGIATIDPLSFAAAAAVLSAAALAACYVPARRATRVDPLVALRYE